MCFCLAGCSLDGANTGAAETNITVQSSAAVTEESLSAAKSTDADADTDTDTEALTEKTGDKSNGSSTSSEKSSAKKNNTTEKTSSSTSKKSAAATTKGTTQKTSAVTTTTSSKYISCYVTVECTKILSNMNKLKAGHEDYVPPDGYIISSKKVSVKNGSSAYDAVKNACSQCNVTINATNSAYGVYVAGFNNIDEKDCGNMSGWLYSVNGVMPSKSCGKYILSNGDSIVFSYTC